MLVYCNMGVPMTKTGVKEGMVNGQFSSKDATTILPRFCILSKLSALKIAFYRSFLPQKLHSIEVYIPKFSSWLPFCW